MLGMDKLNIPVKVVDTFKAWNTQKPGEEEYDKRMTIALLLMYVSPVDLAAHSVDIKIKEFISGKIFSDDMYF